MAEKKDKTEKADKPEKTGGNLMDAVIEQSINEFTRPLVKKISPTTLQMLKKIGADKILPVLSVGFQTFFKDKFGGKTSDVIAEVSAELRRAILEDGGETTATTTETKTTASKEGVEKKAFSVIFNSEISEQTASLMNAWVELFKDDKGNERPEKEQKQIRSLIDKMGPQELYILLTQKKGVRDKTFNAFIKKTTEKSFGEAVKEFKENVKKLVENVKTIYAETIVPVGQKLKPMARRLGVAYEHINRDCADNGAIGRQTIDLRQRSENFRNRRRR